MILLSISTHQLHKCNQNFDNFFVCSFFFERFQHQQQQKNYLHLVALQRPF